ncbi:hypothetical protein JK635_08205 [Neobacillus sp. YIM B02564]|uniref:Tyrosine specific protein phosphatases domain-containing protein n=1 Tax=Neobacillus paridis TaxID=2803862 RepID=A0ABS1TLJ2_9BACI|nr:hypothetical protein [Neobacillus paridis]MBL4952191.1 hypothetical protein [Neobacillus paridis]
MHIMVHSLDQIQSFFPDTTKKNVLIRIEEKPTLLTPFYEDVLHLSFSDITQEEYDDLRGQGLSRGFQLFSITDAKKVLQFVNQHLDADVLHIHCHAGKSRSAAMGIGIQRILGLPDDAIQFRNAPIIPNETVLNILLHAANRA